MAKAHRDPTSRSCRVLPWAQMALWFSIGCARPDYDEVRAGCGLAPGEHRYFERQDPEIWNVEIDRSCATLLGEAIGFDWQSFGLDGPPHLAGAHPDEQLASVLGGLLLLASADFGPATPTVLATAPKPPQDALRRVAPLRGADASLGELLFTVVQGAVYHVERLPNWRNHDNYLGRWARSHTVFLPADWWEPGSDAQGLEILVAESLHREGPHYLNCDAMFASQLGYHPPPTHGVLDCDWDEDSVYGGGAWVLHHILERERKKPTIEGDTNGSLWWNRYQHLYHQRGRVCDRICRIDSDGPCLWRHADREYWGTQCTLGRGFYGGK